MDNVWVGNECLDEYTSFGDVVTAAVLLSFIDSIDFMCVHNEFFVGRG